MGQFQKSDILSYTDGIKYSVSLDFKMKKCAIKDCDESAETKSNRQYCVLHMMRHGDLIYCMLCERPMGVGPGDDADGAFKELFCMICVRDWEESDQQE